MFNRKVRVGRGEGGRGHYHNQRREGEGIIIGHLQYLTVGVMSSSKSKMDDRHLCFPTF